MSPRFCLFLLFRTLVLSGEVPEEMIFPRKGFVTPLAGLPLRRQVEMNSLIGVFGANVPVQPCHVRMPFATDGAFHWPIKLAALSSVTLSGYDMEVTQLDSMFMYLVTYAERLCLL
jgi:hypothetical protein